MSSLATNSQGNIKNVMRTALVGIKPADQVILKGYLRVLLRLEADLEWVSANHPQVDLFLINHEFRESNNVVKLLSDQSSKPVLYVTRAKSGEGWIKDNTIALPLKQMPYLSDWLIQNVSVLSNLTVPQTDDRVNQASHAKQSSQNAQQDKASSPTTKTAAQNTTSSDQDFTNLVKLIKTLQQRDTTAYQIYVSNTAIAVVQASIGRVWPAHPQSKIDHIVKSAKLSDWQLKPYQDDIPMNVAPLDLKQWLWHTSWDALADALPLINGSKVYKIRYWVKPARQQRRSDVLGVMTAIEAKYRNINDIADLSGADVDFVHKTLAGLLLAGYLQPDSYELLKATISDRNQQLNQPNQQHRGSGSKHTPQPARESVSTVDSVLSRRASGDTQTKKTSSEIPASVLSANKSKTQGMENYDGVLKPKQDKKKPEKMGFLSRLRRKLGL